MPDNRVRGKMNELLERINKTSCRLLGLNASQDFTARIEAVDMHCHLDFADDACAIAREAQRYGIGFFSGTVTPEGYERASMLLSGCKNVRVGLGFHPWWITKASLVASKKEGSSLEHFISLAGQTSYINEIGLDFSSRFSETKEAQVKALKAILTCVREGAVLSLHSVKATDVVLDLLEGAELFSSNSCIFHWFSGSNSELRRAIKLGCYFSVGERFLSSKRGREYLKVIPVNQLLLETDLPAQEHSNTTFEELRSSLWAAQDLLLKKSN